MKKRFVALLLCIMATVSLTACGAKGENVEGTETLQEGTESASSYEGKRSSEFDLDYASYVKLADYDKIEVSISGDYEVNDAKVADYITQMFEYYGPYYTADETKTVIQEGDVVDVDYVGKKDGVEFEGGSAQNQIIDVSKNSSVTGTTYIEGFTNGLLGASVGDVIDCNVTFPEEYQNEELAGQEVVFTFTVNAIEKEITQDQMDDAFVAEHFGVDTVAQMETEVRSYLENTAEYNKNNDTYNAIQDWLIENCEVEVPEDYLDARVSEYQYNFEQQNCTDGTSLEDYLSTYYGLTLDEAVERWKEFMAENLKLEFILITISQKEGIEIEEDAYAEYISNMIANSNGANGQSYENEEDLYNSYGVGDKKAGEEYLRRIYVANLALDKLKESASVQITGETEYKESSEHVESTENAEVQEKR